MLRNMLKGLGKTYKETSMVTLEQLRKQLNYYI